MHSLLLCSARVSKISEDIYLKSALITKEGGEVEGLSLIVKVSKQWNNDALYTQ